MSSPSTAAISAHSEHARLEREIEDLSMEILERYEEVNLLYRLTESFRDMFEEEEILGRLLGEAVRAVRADAGWIASFEPAADTPGAMDPSAAAGEDGHVSAARGTLRWLSHTHAESGAGEVSMPPAGAESLAVRALGERRTASTDRGGSTGTAALMAVPLPGKAHPLGCIVLEKPRTEDAFRSGELRMMAAVAAMGASIVENRRLARSMQEAERVKGEIEIARQIQQGLLPASDPVVPGLQVSGMCRPANDIGGDYFGYSATAPGRFGIIIADVSGHSVGAAIGMVMARCLIQSEAHACDSPAKIATRVNELLNRDLTDPGMFVTAFLLVYDEASGHFRYTNAGHNPPLIYRAESGAVDTLRGGSLGLGILPETRYFDRTDLLHPNDLLVLYTDGLTEARSPEGEMFGAERLTQALIECRTMSAPQTLDALIARVGAWRQSTDFVDDLTLVVARKD